MSSPPSLVMPSSIQQGLDKVDKVLIRPGYNAHSEVSWLFDKTSQIHQIHQIRAHLSMRSSEIVDLVVTLNV